MQHDPHTPLTRGIALYTDEPEQENRPWLPTVIMAIYFALVFGIPYLTS